MIRVAVVSPGRDHEFRAQAAQDCDDGRQLQVRRGVQAGIGQPQVLAEGEPEDFRSRHRLLQPQLRRAARRHLAAGQVDDAGAVAPIGHLQQQPATEQLDVVRMRPEGQDLERIRWVGCCQVGPVAWRARCIGHGHRSSKRPENGWQSANTRSMKRRHPWRAAYAGSPNARSCGTPPESQEIPQAVALLERRRLTLSERSGVLGDEAIDHLVDALFGPRDGLG